MFDGRQNKETLTKRTEREEGEEDCEMGRQRSKLKREKWTCWEQLLLTLASRDRHKGPV